MKLILNEFGLFLGRKRNRYVIRNESENEVQSTDVEQIHILNPGVSVSTSAIRLALENQTLVIFGNRYGWPHGFVVPAKISGTIKGKREQFLAYMDFRGAILAKKFAAGKAFNQRNLLKLLWKNRTRTEPQLAETLYQASEEIERLARETELIKGDNVDKIRIDIMNKEALASKKYWAAVANLFPEELKFPGRKTKGAQDPVNAMLNFGYKAILFVECWKSIYYAGLDPYAGYLHADRPGKPSLVLDFMEEFRQHTVDRVILSMFSKKMIKTDELVEYSNITNQQMLSNHVLRSLTGEITNQLESYVAYNGNRVKLKDVIQNQARFLASFLMNPSREYVTFELLW